jgi:hypothetical protein
VPGVMLSAEATEFAIRRDEGERLPEPVAVEATMAMADGRADYNGPAMRVG